MESVVTVFQIIPPVEFNCNRTSKYFQQCIIIYTQYANMKLEKFRHDDDVKICYNPPLCDGQAPIDHQECSGHHSCRIGEQEKNWADDVSLLSEKS